MINVTRQQTVSYIIEPGPGVGLAPFALPEERAIALRDALNDATGHDSTFADVEVKRLRADVERMTANNHALAKKLEETREEWAREAVERMVTEERGVIFICDSNQGRGSLTESWVVSKKQRLIDVLMGRP